MTLISNNIILFGHPAYRLVSTADDGWKFMEYGTIVGNNYYTVSFSAWSEKYSDYLPTAQEIINSFHVAGQ